MFAHFKIRCKVAVWERRARGFRVFPNFLLILFLFLSQRIQAPPITAYNELYQIITSSAGLKNKLIHMAVRGSHRVSV